MSVADALQRQRALNPTASFAVSAPAGSGKTGLLTQRVLKLLALVDQPEEILCLTFTRKAAAEMRQRITGALATAASSNQPDDSYEATTWQLAQAVLERDQQQNWQLLQSPNRLRITTIDGFFRHLAQQLALESQLGDQIEPLDNPQPHYNQVTASFLLQQLQQNGPWAGDIATLLRHLDNNLNRLQGLLTELLGKREQWLHHLLAARNARPYLEKSLQETIAETLSALAAQLQPIASELALLADYAASRLLADHRDSPLTLCAGMEQLPPCDHHHLDQWQALVHLLLTNANEFRSDRGINIKLGFPTAKADPEFGERRKQQLKDVLAWSRDQESLLELLIDTRFLPAAHYSEQQWAVLNALTNLLPTLAAELGLHFQQQGCSDFTDITFAALRALGDADGPTDLAMKLDYRLRHILIDEFQDTSSIQYMILQQLIAEWVPGDGRTLFIVGDGMQSLYGFRNANVGLFMEARQQPVANIRLEPLDLSVNFRSQRGIIDWVNNAFRVAFPALENIGRGAVRYSPADAHKPVTESPPVTIDLFRDHPDNSAEAAEVVRLVQQARQQRPDGTVAILVRNRSHLKDILKALRAAGISWQATEVDPLQHKMAVMDLMSLTRALLSAADHIAWLSILRAPWCGLDLHDLYHLTNYRLTHHCPEEQETPTSTIRPLIIEQLGRYQQIDAISPDGRQILARVSGILLTAWQQRDRLPLRQRIENTWLALGGPEALKNPTDQEFCQQYFDFLEQQSPVHDWSLFQQAVEKLYAVPNPAADRNIQVMTIHKAKGLEFDTVIIPALDRASRANQQELLLWRERIAEDGRPQLLIAPLQGAGEEKGSLYQHLQQEANIKETLESTRVLYVGATRAIHQLHLLCKLDSNKTPAKNSLLARLWPWLETAIDEGRPSVRVHQAPLAKDSAADDPVLLPSFSHLWRLPADFSKGAELKLPESTASGQSSPTPIFAPDTADAKHTGTVLHRIIHQITVQGIEKWRKASLSERQSHWASQLRQLGVVDINQAVQRLRQAIDNLLSDQQHHWLLDNSCEDSLCEYPIGYIDNNNRVRTAIIDRSFVRDGIRWLIDYKSSCPKPDQSMVAFLNEQQAEYLSQLTLYERLLIGMDKNPQQPLPVKKALYFPLCQQLTIIE